MKNFYRAANPPVLAGRLPFLRDISGRAGTIRVSHDTIRITIQLTRYDIYHDTLIRHKDTEKDTERSHSLGMAMG